MISPNDHFRSIKIREMPSLPQVQAHPLVPRYALEPDPRGGSAGDAASQAASITQIFNNNLSNVMIQVSDLQNQIDCFSITCNEDGTLSWTFECD